MTRTTWKVARMQKMMIDIQKPLTPESLMLCVAGCRALERDLQRGVQVVAVVAEQDVDAHPEDRRQQHEGDDEPHRQAFAAGEVLAGDPPPLSSPGGEFADQQQETSSTHTAVMPKALSTHHADAANSWLQSMDGANGFRFHRTTLSCAWRPSTPLCGKLPQHSARRRVMGRGPSVAWSNPPARGNRADRYHASQGVEQRRAFAGGSVRTRSDRVTIDTLGRYHAPRTLNTCPRRNQRPAAPKSAEQSILEAARRKHRQGSGPVDGAGARLVGVRRQGRRHSTTSSCARPPSCWYSTSWPSRPTSRSSSRSRGRRPNAQPRLRPFDVQLARRAAHARGRRRRDGDR